jgi:periplasmic copper chaperone A
VIAAPPPAIVAAWSRPAIGTGVVYLRISSRSTSPDTLDGARSPVAAAAELHRSSMTMGTMKGMTMGDVSTMTPVHALALPPHATLSLAPGGAHVMLIGLKHDLHANERFLLQLHFARAGWQTVRVTVRPI